MSLADPGPISSLLSDPPARGLQADPEPRCVSWHCSLQCSSPWLQGQVFLCHPLHKHQVLHALLLDPGACALEWVLNTCDCLFYVHLLHSCRPAGCNVWVMEPLCLPGFMAGLYGKAGLLLEDFWHPRIDNPLLPRSPCGAGWGAQSREHLPG